MLGLPMFDRGVHVEQVGAADHVLETPDPERGHQLADLLGDKHQVVDDVVGGSLEAPSKLGILRGDPDWASVQVAFSLVVR